MQRARRFATMSFAVAMVAALLSGCGAEGGSATAATTTTADRAVASTTTEATATTEDATEGPDAGDGSGAVDDDCFIDADGHGPDCDGGEAASVPGDDCYIDADGHGPDCDQETVGMPGDDCYIDTDGHGPDCGEEGLGGPDDLRYLSGWDTDGSGLDVGSTFTLTCEPNGTPGEVWGTGPYADDSSLCTAAVHAGRITVKGGGTVGGQRIESRRTLPGGTANGIDGQPADNWRGAIEFF